MVKERVIKHIKQGNKQVFEELYSAYYHKLLFFSKQYLLDADEAVDVTQDVFTTLWEKRLGLADDTNIQAWLMTVAKNKSLKRIKKIQSKSRYLTDIKYRELGVNNQALIDFDDVGFDFKELEGKVEEALKKLSPSVRAVFEKSRFENKRYREIADELDISIKTVEAHMSKSLKLLRVELKDYLPLLIFLFDN